MSNTAEKKHSLDFEAIEASADIEALLNHYGYVERGTLKLENGEWVGWCPLGEHHGREDSFRLNDDKKMFHCFACKQKGKIIKLITKIEGVERLQDGALKIQEIMDAAQPVQIEKTNGTPVTSVDDNVTTTGFLTLREAVDKVKSGDKKADDFIVVDVGVLQFIKQLVQK